MRFLVCLLVLVLGFSTPTLAQSGLETSVDNLLARFAVMATTNDKVRFSDTCRQGETCVALGERVATAIAEAQGRAQEAKLCLGQSASKPARCADAIDKLSVRAAEVSGLVREFNAHLDVLIVRLQERVRELQERVRRMEGRSST